MQEWCEDYSQGEYNTGCCLYCDDSYKGCLCYDCKCTQCYWYNKSGFCELVSVLKKAREEKQMNIWLDNYSKNVKEKRLKENKGQTELRDHENE